MKTEIIQRAYPVPEMVLSSRLDLQAWNAGGLVTRLSHLKAQTAKDAADAGWVLLACTKTNPGNCQTTTDSELLFVTSGLIHACMPGILPEEA
jgi:hypothetical protein